MTRELFVSSTPHECKVGVVEDDQLAEIYLERENEYTLGGSIYKGRVTRVLPGMQSAFVDIGLERDAFLYVSDFMELHDEDVEDIPTSRSFPLAAPRAGAQPAMETPVAPEPEAVPEEPVEAVGLPADQPQRSNGGEPREGRGDWRNRRRRGRRGERMPESKFAKPAAETPPSAGRGDYGPPPGYQPILLPGESISKYQRLTHAQAAGVGASPSGASSESAQPTVNAFPEDEPLFAKAEHETS